MALRKCTSCGSDLPAGSTARARFCSATCRKRASRAKGEAPTLKLVPPAQPSDQAEPATRLEALEATATRLDKLLDQADPRSAAALNKEYRETLRELDTLRAATAPEGENRQTRSNRRPFDASAI